jgi:hypothetical protein
LVILPALHRELLKKLNKKAAITAVHRNDAGGTRFFDISWTAIFGDT